MAIGYQVGEECMHVSEYLADQWSKTVSDWAAIGCNKYQWSDLYTKISGNVPNRWYTRRECNGSVSGYQSFGFPDGAATCEIVAETVTDPNDPSTIDYAQSAEFWGFAFVTIMSFYMVAKNIGLILEAVKKW